MFGGDVSLARRNPARSRSSRADRENLKTTATRRVDFSEQAKPVERVTYRTLQQGKKLIIKLDKKKYEFDKLVRY
jgi:hypothetical protein